MKTKLESSINFITTKTSMIGDKKVSYFVMEDNLRFIDLDNLSKYTTKELISICRAGKIKNAKKADYIFFILKNEKLVNQIKSDNREFKLRSLGV